LKKSSNLWCGRGCYFFGVVVESLLTIDFGFIDYIFLYR